ncbi:MAG: dihydrolipoyl dehydrogenase [Gemmataceae bacterium]|nr:dihydrolipoyl dehydrogenase [Gemmataceae bacterium]MCI0740688.1 dihydrolipoyl dehydrogenase [Gemmataceae bacterium]
MPDPFDLVVVGAGPGGYIAAIRGAQLGLRVACVEKNKALGGACLNVGCIPSKALLDSSEWYHLAKQRFERHGIGCGDLRLDLARMLARKNQIVKGLTDGVAFLFRKNKVAAYHGAAQLVGKNRVMVAGEQVVELEAKAILLATGSEPAPLPFLAFDGVGVVSSTEALMFEQVPQHLIVIGAGYIGLELGSVWSRLGAKVTVLEFLPKLLPANDGELAGLLHKALSKQGLEIHLGAKVTGAKKKGKQVTVQAEHGDDMLEFTGDKVLVAVGRRPVTDGLGLEETGVRLDDKTGKVLVDDKYQTSVPHLFAIGDLVAGPMLAHKASEEGIAVAENLAGKPGHVNYSAIPSVIYTTPELAAVGLTEEQAKENGKPYKVGKFHFQANARAKCLDETEGLVKVITDAKTDRVLGLHILGPRASDLIGEGVLALEFGATAEDIARTCHGHPTLSEAVGEAARAAWDKALQA